jgi:hypothetical protein
MGVFRGYKETEMRRPEYQNKESKFMTGTLCI